MIGFIVLISAFINMLIICITLEVPLQHILPVSFCFSFAWAILWGFIDDRHNKKT